MNAKSSFVRVMAYLICLFSLLNSYGQFPDQQTFEKYAKTSLEEFRELLSLPNDAHEPSDIEKNVAWCESHFKARGFSVKRLFTPGAPLLLGERRAEAPNAPTVLIYLQIDGQPVDPSFWNQKNPYQPVLKQRNDAGVWEQINWQSLYRELDPEWRIFARSVSDAKGPVAMFLTALDLMTNERKKPNFNMKVIMDFEEEMGSPNLPDAVIRYGEMLASDMLIIFDGPRHITNQPTLTFGARGITTITLEVFGPIEPQHSGHYGNYAPNPAIRLAQVIASMKDAYGRVTIPGFYDGIILSSEVKSILKSVPDDEAFINSSLGISEADRVAPTYQESLQYPSLNVRGFSSGWVGKEARTIVPSSAVAEIDIRLVLESDPDRLIGLVKDHIDSQGYYLVDKPPTAAERSKYSKICQFNATTSYLAFRTDFDSKAGTWLSMALTKAFGGEPVRLRTSGGSIPISPFVNELGIPAVTVPTVNRDNNQHSPNENLRVGNYIDGIKTIYAILTEPLDL
jgi:acetylornithine deacetylase/succinyl-diaminopimelate desuccinylase-like protein